MYFKHESHFMTSDLDEYVPESAPALVSMVTTHVERVPEDCSWVSSRME